MTAGFSDISAYRRRHDFISLHNAIRVNYEASAHLDTGIFIINAVEASNIAVLVRKHRIRNAALDHFGQLMIFPHFVDKDAVNTDGQDFYAKLLKLWEFVSDR